MGYADTERANGNLSVAQAGTKCMGATPYSGTGFRCAGADGNPADAVHTWEGRHYCAYHSPFDVWVDEAPVETRKAHHTDTPGPVMVYWPMSKIRHSVQMWNMHVKSVLTYGVPAPLDAQEEKEYGQYISDGLADTDGYYAPMSRDSWKSMVYPQRRLRFADLAAYGVHLRGLLSL